MRIATQALSPGGSTTLDAATLEAIAEEAPSVSKPRSEVVGCALADLLAAVGMQPSKSAAKRLIKVGLHVKPCKGYLLLQVCNALMPVLPKHSCSDPRSIVRCHCQCKCDFLLPRCLC